MDSLLSFDRAMSCMKHDLIQQQEDAMRHGNAVHLGRAFAPIAVRDEPPAHTDEYEFTQIRVGLPPATRRMKFESAIEANTYASALQEQGCVVIFDRVEERMTQ
jgi:hypothetical protein